MHHQLSAVGRPMVYLFDLAKAVHACLGLQIHLGVPICIKAHAAVGAV